MITPKVEGLRFHVLDSGVGFEPHCIARLFEAFAQGDDSLTRRKDGAGLGLTLVKHHVDLMRKALGVESTPGLGSVFWFSIPVRPAASADGSTVARAA